MKGGLTAEELKDVRAAWQQVLAANIGDLSSGLLLEWWEKEPSVVTVFPRYAGKSLGELKALPRVRSHGTHIFLAIACVLLNIENDAVTSELLADLKRDHAMFQPNISADAFNKFSLIAVGYLKAKLGAVMTPAAESGFKKLLALLGSEGGIHHLARTHT